MASGFSTQIALGFGFPESKSDTGVEKPEKTNSRLYTIIYHNIPFYTIIYHNIPIDLYKP